MMIVQFVLSSGFVPSQYFSGPYSTVFVIFCRKFFCCDSPACTCFFVITTTHSNSVLINQRCSDFFLIVHF